MSSDLEFEPIPGLPAELPPGERILWQGRPSWKALARSTFRVRWLGAYFLIFATTRVGLAVAQHETVSGSTLAPFGLGGLCLGILYLVAWLNARATVYTVTSRRVVFRIGVAIPTTWNLPFARLASADLTVRRDGDGDIVLQLRRPDRVAWLHLWPHTQPWHLARARPTLRAIDEPHRVAEVLSQAIREWGQSSGAPVVTSAESFAPSGTPAVRPVAMDGQLLEVGP
jgi:hypothetical protein